MSLTDIIGAFDPGDPSTYGQDLSSLSGDGSGMMDPSTWDPTQWGAGLSDYPTDPNDPLGLGIPTTDSGINSVLGGSGAGQTGSFLSKLLGGSQSGQNLADISKVLGGLSSGEKANRFLQGNFTQGYDRNMLDAQQARNQNESDAIKKLAQTSYLANGGSHFQLPTSLSLGGVQHAIPNLGFGPSSASAAQMQGANTLQGQLLARLMPGGSYTPQPLSSYATPGPSENIGNWGSVATGGAGALANIFNPQSQNPQTNG